MNNRYSLQPIKPSNASSTAMGCISPELISIGKSTSYLQVITQQDDALGLLQSLKVLITEKEHLIEELTAKLNKPHCAYSLPFEEETRLQALLSNRNAQISALLAQVKESQEDIWLRKRMYDDLLDKYKKLSRKSKLQEEAFTVYKGRQKDNEGVYYSTKLKLETVTKLLEQAHAILHQKNADQPSRCPP